MGLFENACRPAKNDPAERVLTSLFPVPILPKGPKEKPSTNYPKRLPLRLPHHQCATPGTDPLSRPHLRINCVDPTEDS